MLTRLNQFTFAFLMAASLAFTAGCGGGGSSGGGSGDSGTGDEPLPVGGNNVAGPADPVQDTLTSVGEGAGDAPVIGDSAQALVDSLVSLLDAPDGLAVGFQDFLASQDPEDLFNGGEDAGDAVLSFAAGVSETLIQLSEEGEAIPGSENLLPLLTDLQTQVQDGITGETDGGDLTAITDLLVQIAGRLDQASGQVPAQVENAPLVGDLLAALSDGTNDLATILDATGRLDGDDTSAALVGAFENVLTNLSGSLPGDAGSALNAAVADATTQFQNGLALVLDPLFQALRGVLAPVTGDNAPLAPVLGSVLSLSGGGSLDGFGGASGLSDVLQGGGMAGDGTQIPLLSDLLAGVPVLGDLLAGILGGDAGGGTQTLTNVLENGGNGNLPLLGDLLQGIPNLSQPGSSGPLSLPLLGDLVTTLLSLDGDGVPVISDILAGGSTGDGLDIPVVGNLLDSLLGDLLGAAGGVDSTGGFLDGLGGIPVLGSILDSILGGLLSSS